MAKSIITEYTKYNICPKEKAFNYNSIHKEIDLWTGSWKLIAGLKMKVEKEL